MCLRWARVVFAGVGVPARPGSARIGGDELDEGGYARPFGGHAVAVSSLRRVAPDGHFLEDASRALPADAGGTPTGRLGDAAAFSFYATKTVTAGGEGGMLITYDDAVANRAARTRPHGIDADAWNRYGAGGRWSYAVEAAGFKYNLTDLAAAIGLVQFEHLDELAEARAAIAARYDSAVSNAGLVPTPPRRAGDRHAWHFYVVELRLEDLAVDREAVMRELAAAGIGSSMHSIPLHLHPHYRRTYGSAPGDFPVAERLFSRSISLPIWPGMTEAQIDRVSQTLLAIVDGAPSGRSLRPH